MLILSGYKRVSNMSTGKVSNSRLSGFGAATISQISQQAKQVTKQSKKVEAVAKDKISTANAVTSQLRQALTALKGTSLSGLGRMGYGAVSIQELKAQLAKKKINIEKTNQVIDQAKQALKR